MTDLRRFVVTIATVAAGALAGCTDEDTATVTTTSAAPTTSEGAPMPSTSHSSSASSSSTSSSSSSSSSASTSSSHTVVRTDGGTIEVSGAGGVLDVVDVTAAHPGGRSPSSDPTTGAWRPRSPGPAAARTWSWSSPTAASRARPAPPPPAERCGRGEGALRPHLSPLGIRVQSPRVRVASTWPARSWRAVTVTSVPAGGLDDPRHQGAVRRAVVPELEAGGRPALELAELLAGRPTDDRRPGQLGHQRPHEPGLAGLDAHVCGQPPRVGDPELDPPGVASQLDGGDPAHLQARRRHRLSDGEAGVRRHLGGQPDRGGLVQMPRWFQPPSSTGPSCGWSNGYQST